MDLSYKHIQTCKGRFICNLMVFEPIVLEFLTIEQILSVIYPIYVFVAWKKPGAGVGAGVGAAWKKRQDPEQEPLRN